MAQKFLNEFGVDVCTTIALNNYYLALETMLTLAAFADAAKDSTARGIREKAKDIRPDWEVGTTRNPYREQLTLVLEGRRRALASIDGYLRLSRLERLQLAVLGVLERPRGARDWDGEQR